MQGICFFPPIAQEYVFLVCECDPEQDVSTHPKTRGTHTYRKGWLRHFKGGRTSQRDVQGLGRGENLHVCVCVCTSVAFGIFVLCKRVF